MTPSIEVGRVVGGAAAQAWAGGELGASLSMLVLAAAVSLFAGRVVRGGWNWVLLIFSVSTAVTLAAVWVRGPRLSPLQQVIESCAALSLLWALVSVVYGRRPMNADLDGPSPGSLGGVVRLAALLFGATAAIPQVLILVMRIVVTTVDLTKGFPSRPPRNYGFEAAGLWSFAMLFGSTIAGWFVTRDRRLAACGFWLAALFVAWAVLLVPPFRADVSGAFERSAMTLILLVGLSSVVGLGVGVTGAALSVGSPLNAEREGTAPTPVETLVPGISGSCAALSIVILLLGCYHLLVPIELPWGGHRIPHLVAGASLAVSALAVFRLLRHEWSDGLADAGMGLASLALCGFVVTLAPLGGSLGDSYPVIFNLLIVALALATGGWTWVACIWTGPVGNDVPEGWRDRLVSHAKRFAFLCAALALVAAALMTYWPRIPTISSMDHSLGRVTAGFGTHLLLLLVMLWSSRRLHRMTFHMLTVLSVLSTAAFLVVRMIPFASRAG